MSIIGKFHVTAEMFPLTATIQSVPDAVIEVERVVSMRTTLTPYFWVSDCDLAAFERAVDEDPSIQNVRRLDTFEDAALFSGEWTEQTEAILFVYREVNAVILEATGRRDGWSLRVRFENYHSLQDFNEYCQANGIEFELKQLFDETEGHQGSQFGLTEKQADALTTAWRAGYFETPRRATLDDVADELGIAKQSAAQLLRRAHHRLVGNALATTPPDDESEEDI
jgi:predicted DNA binding protein